MSPKGLRVAIRRAMPISGGATTTVARPFLVSVNSVVTRVRKHAEKSGVAFRMTDVRSCAPAGIRQPRSGQQSRLSQASRKTAQQFFGDGNLVMAAICCPERLTEFAIRKTHRGIHQLACAPWNIEIVSASRRSYSSHFGQLPSGPIHSGCWASKSSWSFFCNSAYE